MRVCGRTARSVEDKRCLAWKIILSSVNYAILDPARRGMVRWVFETKGKERKIEAVVAVILDAVDRG